MRKLAFKEGVQQGKDQELGFLSIIEGINEDEYPEVRGCDCTDSADTDSGISSCVDSDSCFDSCDADVDGCTDTSY